MIALRLASTKAKAKAEEMAAALGLKIVRVLSVIEVRSSVTLSGEIGGK